MSRKRWKERPLKIALIVSDFNFDVTSLMLERARRHAEFLGAEVTRVTSAPRNSAWRRARSSIRDVTSKLKSETIRAIFNGRSFQRFLLIRAGHRLLWSRLPHLRNSRPGRSALLVMSLGVDYGLTRSEL